VFVEKWYGIGSSGRIRVTNKSISSLKVQFRSATDSTKTLKSGECVDLNPFPYTEIFFKSIDGSAVTIDCGSGRCWSGPWPSLVEEPSETASREENQILNSGDSGVFSDQEVSSDMREQCIQIAEDIRNGDYDSE